MDEFKDVLTKNAASIFGREASSGEGKSQIIIPRFTHYSQLSSDLLIP